MNLLMLYFISFSAKLRDTREISLYKNFQLYTLDFTVDQNTQDDCLPKLKGLSKYQQLRFARYRGYHIVRKSLLS